MSLRKFSIRPYHSSAQNLRKLCLHQNLSMCKPLHALARETDLTTSGALAPSLPRSSHACSSHAGLLAVSLPCSLCTSCPLCLDCPSLWLAPSLPAGLTLSERPSWCRLWSLPNKMPYQEVRTTLPSPRSASPTERPSPSSPQEPAGPVTICYGGESYPSSLPLFPGQAREEGEGGQYSEGSPARWRGKRGTQPQSHPLPS